MAERWGGRHVVGISLFLSGLLTGLSPLLAQDSFWPIFAARFLLGVLGVSVENKLTFINFACRVQHREKHSFPMSTPCYHMIL